MIDLDMNYVMDALGKGLIKGPCLELGAALEGNSLRSRISDQGIEYYSTDLYEGVGVDFVIDFEKPVEEIRQQVSRVGSFGTIIIMNVLEHTFDPVCVLDNVMALVADGGTCIVTTPTVFCLHDYPIDCWRLMPGFYIEYAKRRGFELVDGSLQYLGYGPVEQYKRGDQIIFPRPYNGNAKDRYSQLIHKYFRTWGRWICYPDGILTGAILRKPL